MRPYRFVVKMTIFIILVVVGMRTASAQPQGSQVNGVDDAIIFFKQPHLENVTSNFHVPQIEKKYPSKNDFNFILWQPNPYRTDGLLIPVSWNAGDRTGFYPQSPQNTYQLGFQDQPGTSTAQIEGDVIGAYLNSNDARPDGRGETKMMMTPAYRPFNRAPVYPFANQGGAVVNSLKLQVPTAYDLNRPGNFTYVVVDMVFNDARSHTDISYGVALFHHAPLNGKHLSTDYMRKTEVGPYDVESHSFQVGNPLQDNSRVVTLLPHSESYQFQPWRGWRQFNFAITKANFKKGLEALKDKAPGFSGSLQPEDYSLLSWHLNAELQFGSGPAALGWSMKDALVTLISGEDLMGEPGAHR